MTISTLSLRGSDFLSIADHDGPALGAILERAAQVKSGAYSDQPLRGKAVAMLFQKPSNRTRVSFEVGIARLGGTTVTLGEQDVQMGTRETVPDTARVLERYVDIIVGRLRRHADLVELARYARVPVVNALTELEHPCQVLADLQTIAEKRGTVAGCRVAFVGDGNNMVRSLWQAAQRLDFTLVQVGPPGFHLPEAPEIFTSSLDAVAGADVVYTDVWTSMGYDAEREARRAAFAAYTVDAAVMERAPGAIFMHCLPANRGDEVTDEVIDGPASVVFDQAENRLHAQVALLSLIAGAG